MVAPYTHQQEIRHEVKSPDTQGLPPVFDDIDIMQDTIVGVFSGFVLLIALELFIKIGKFTNFS